MPLVRPIALLELALLLFAPTSGSPLISYVDPLIGTGGGNGMGSFAAGNLNPGAMAPFPLLRLGPDTTFAQANGTILYLGNDHLAGYSFNDTHVLAFSHTHVQGGGCGDLGSFGVMLATNGTLAELVAGSATRGDAPYKTRLQHTGERARPGSYSLLLPDLGGSLVELVAAGTHTGLHRYSCAAAACTLLVDACHGTHDGGCPAANATIAPLGNASFALTASVLDHGYFARQGGGAQVWVHLAAVLEVSASAPAQVGLWSAATPLPPGTPATPANDTSGSVGLYVTVPGPAVLLLRVALSLVSPSGAAANLLAEQGSAGGAQAASGGGLSRASRFLSLEALQARTEGVWESALGSLQLGGAPPPAPPPPPPPPAAPALCPSLTPPTLPSCLPTSPSPATRPGCSARASP